MAIGPQIKGIYKIESTYNGKIYIGCSTNIQIRWRNHKSLLKRNKHQNQHLQNHYNKYGISDLKFDIIEDCWYLTPREIFLKEEYYILKLNSHINKNFNMTIGGIFKTSDSRKLKCSITNIHTLEVKEFDCIKDAADHIQIDSSSMSKVLKGKKKQMKGWCATDLGYDETELSRKNRCLIHAEFGKVYIGENICEFARKYNLNEQLIYRLFTKPNRNKSYKGWTLENPTKNKCFKEVACYTKDRLKIHQFLTLTSAAKEFNCSPSSIGQALKEPFIKTSMGYYWNYL